MAAKKIKLQRPRNKAELDAADTAMGMKYGTKYTHPEDFEADIQKRMDRVFNENAQKEAKAITQAKKSAEPNPEELNRLDVPDIIKRIKKGR